MNNKESFENLQKINIVKGSLLVSDIDENSILKLINELFDDAKNLNIEQIKSALVNGDMTLTLNHINNYKENIIKLLFQNPCSKKWNDLVDTNNNKEKYCTDCKKNVYLVSSEEEMIKRKKLQQCVAINTTEVDINKVNDKNYKACRIKFEAMYELGLPLTTD